MEYNSTKEELILPEYGRNIQCMAQHCITIEDRAQRNRAANEVISIMGNMFPYLRDVRDFKHKLWDHLAVMTNFELDVDYPYEITRPEVLKANKQRLPYTSNKIKIRHYGRTTERMIDRAIELSDSAEKKAMVMHIANNMKKQYLAWNKNSVTDAIIKKDLELLSKGQLSIAEETRLSNYSQPTNAPTAQSNSNNNPRYIKRPSNSGGPSGNNGQSGNNMNNNGQSNNNNRPKYYKKHK